MTPPPPSPPASGEVSLVFTELGGIRYALRAEEAIGFGDAAERAPADRSLDLCRATGATPPPGDERRVARFRMRGGALSVRMGTSTLVRPVAASAVRPVPPLLVHAARRFGCSGVVEQPGGFAFLLEAELLVALADHPAAAGASCA